ncbi:MAG: hypothetical protein V1776_03485 [Candidatus Diapherotrites archaeon]
MTSNKSLWKNWKVLLWAFFLLGSLALILNVSFTNGISVGHNLKLGSEFSGGTLFQLQLAEPATAAQMSEIRFIVEKRLNPNGLRDVTVSNTGNQIILAQVAETDPAQVENLQELLLKQGRFESFLNGELVFDGGQIIQVVESANQGYGAHPSGTGNSYVWTLPFLLNDAAARKFSESSFHQCIQTGFSAGSPSYDCAATYFFIDRPTNAIVVYPSSVRSSDAGKIGASAYNFPASTTISSILTNANLRLVETDENGLTAEGSSLLLNIPDNVKSIIVPDSINEELVEQIKGLTTIPIVTVEEKSGIAWIVDVSGLRDVINLSPGITGNDPYIENVKDVAPLPFLVITGTAPDAAEAKMRLDDLRILLKSGALPIPIISINKQTVSAELGGQFLSNVWLMGLLALIVVSLIVFIRYRELKLVAPLLVVGLSEVVMILGFAALVKWNLDLASMAGILAAVGTGVDSEVIMTDEILRQEKDAHESDEKGLAARAKRAFFIVSASASTGIAAMLPLVILGSGIGKLTGFALTTIAGVLLGVLISRPAFQEIIKLILNPNKEQDDAATH